MTKEQAIEVLHELDGSLYETQQVALDMAIKALEQQPSDDCIEKLEQIEQIAARWNNDASHSFEDMCKINGILKE